VKNFADSLKSSATTPSVAEKKNKRNLNEKEGQTQPKKRSFRSTEQHKSAKSAGRYGTRIQMLFGVVGGGE